MTYQPLTGLFINNEFIQSSTGKTVKVTNPATAEIITFAYPGYKYDVEYAVQSNQNVSSNTNWATQDPKGRLRILLRPNGLIEENVELMNSIETIGNGKSDTLARGDTHLRIDCLRDAFSYADKVNGRTIDYGNGYMNFTLKQVIGICGQIIIWNFATMVLTMKVTATLTIGTIYILKLSSTTSLTALV